MKRMKTLTYALCALGLVAGNAFARDTASSGSSARNDQNRPARAAFSRTWTPGTEIREWHGRQVVVLPAWKSEPAALGQDDNSGHVP